MIVLNNAKDRKGKEWVATIGFFDGVHCGHRHLIKELQQLADERQLPTAIFTFPIHPRIVLQADYQPKLLNSFDEKLKQLATTGVDYCAILDFTPQLATLSAHDFIAELAERWHVHTLLIGYDHRFGHNRSEGFHEYVAYGSAYNIEIVQASSYEAGTGTISSSRIRQLLADCRVEEAARFLTYPYHLKGQIVSGYQIGRKLGFPTANIKVDNPFKIWPGKGVYAVWAYVEGIRYKGMLSIGNRPTLNGEEVVVEVHILHFSGMIYEQVINVEFIQYLRENRKFGTLDELKFQLENDRREVERILT